MEVEFEKLSKSGETINTIYASKMIWIAATIAVVTKLLGTIISGPLCELFTNTVVNITELLVFEALILSSSNFKIDKTLTIFCSICLISTIINNPPAYYKSYERLGFFVIMLCLLSPLLQSKQINRFRDKAWDILIWGLRICITLTFISFIPKVWGMKPMDFPGTFPQKMLTAILDAVVLVEISWRILCCKNKTSITAIYILLAFLWSILLIWCGSRSAIMGTLAAMIFLLIYSRPKIKKLFACGGFILLLVVTLSIFPNSPIKIINYKFDLGHQHGSVTYSRDNLWGARWLEFEESPILGIGFANATHYSEKPEDIRINDDDCHTSEPGSSWLSVLSNTGIAGFLVLAWFNVLLIKQLLNALRRKITMSILLSGLYLLLLIHGCFEGWVLYGGSITFFIYWLMTYKIYSLKNNTDHLQSNSLIN